MTRIIYESEGTFFPDQIGTEPCAIVQGRSILRVFPGLDEENVRVCDEMTLSGHCPRIGVICPRTTKDNPDTVSIGWLTVSA